MPLPVWPLKRAPWARGGDGRFFEVATRSKRWLDAIEPAERRREVAIALAARAALRVLPLFGRELGAASGRTTKSCRPSFWRLCAPPRCRGSRPNIRPSGDALRTAAFAVPSMLLPTPSRRRRRASTPPGHRRRLRHPRSRRRRRSPPPTRCHRRRIAAQPTPRPKLPRRRHLCRATPPRMPPPSRRRADRLRPLRRELAGTPLWPDGAPNWAPGWRPQIRAPRRRPGLGSLDRLVRGAARRRRCPSAKRSARNRPRDDPGRNLEQGPAVVNAEIKRLIDRASKPSTAPSGFQFRVVDDKRSTLLPDDARPIDAETARDFYDEAKRKGQDLRDRLQRTQADENIRAHVDLLLTRLDRLTPTCGRDSCFRRYAVWN